MSTFHRMSHRSSGTGAAVLFGDSLISQIRVAEFSSVPASGTGDSLSRAATHLVRTFRVSRVLTGLFLILHGLAHSRPGTVLIDPARSWRLFEGTVLGTVVVWIVGTLWAVSMLGFIAGGLGLLGVVGLRNYSRRFVLAAAIASVLLLALAAKPYAIVGAVIDVVLFVLLGFTEIRLLRGQWIWHRTLLEEVAEPPRTMTRARRIARTSGNILGWAFLMYVTLLVALRPWHLTWGATAAELEMTLPGDGMAPRVVATHALTINAPASAVWPWLVQIGQDRGGFYSYTTIEDGLLRAGIRNADRIHPEWQQLREGDFVRSARRDWLGGRFANRTGWWVTDVEPGRSITLLGWGTFALVPVDSMTTRFVVRSRGGDGGFLSAPLDVLFLEPGHFLMERRMMLGIRQRAEASDASIPGATGGRQ
jgi:hypothetical protein